MSSDPPNPNLPLQPLGQTDLRVTACAFGTFKLGRNQKTKYGQPYDLPDDAAVERLLNGVLDLGIQYIDTAPAYGLSEDRVGRAIGHRSHEFIVSTKVGEAFENGESQYDFSSAAIRRSVECSLRRLRRDALDLVFIHAHGDDVAIQRDTEAVPTLQGLKRAGLIRAIGLSGKTVAGAEHALTWADALMVEYHERDASHAGVIAAAAARGVGVVVKKGLASGHLPAAEAIRYVLGNPHVTSLVVGGLDLEHVEANVQTAAQCIANRRDPQHA